MSSAISDNFALDPDGLLEPIPGDAPAGDANAYLYELHERLTELGREDDPDDYDDATRPEQLKKSDWPGVAAAASEALRTRTKDLRVACHLVEALTRVDGLAGLGSGLALLQRMVENCWDRLNPPLEADDQEARSAPLANMLDDPIRGLCFPNVVRGVPILGSGKHTCSTAGWEKLLERKGEGEQELDAVVAASGPQRLKQVAADAEACLEQLEQLKTALEAKMGPAAPGFVYLGQALQDCNNLANQVLRQVSGGSGQDTASVETAAEDDDAGQSPPAAGPQSRSEAYDQIEAAAEMLRRLEPHSPVPYLVKRAVALGRLPFPALIKQLVREESVLSELYREFGIPTSDNAGATTGA